VTHCGVRWVCEKGRVLWECSRINIAKGVRKAPTAWPKGEMCRKKTGETLEVQKNEGWGPERREKNPARSETVRARATVEANKAWGTRRRKKTAS